MESAVADNIRQIRMRIAQAAVRVGRDPAEVRLMAVTKTVDDGRIREAIAAGVDIVGENYVQEARRKIELMGKAVSWHMIGHLQTNKAKYAVRLFDLIHSVDRMDLACELDRRASLLNATVPVLIEVNVSGEASKSGVPLAAAPALIGQAARLPRLSIRGLMTMPPWFDDPEEARPYFRSLRKLGRDIMALDLPGVEMQELSMGMSQDFAVAVEEGATIVRVGRGIFGERPPKMS